MKKSIILVLFLSIVCCARAQEAPGVKPIDNTREEIFGMLELLGAEAWRFDLSAFSASEYRFKSYIDEYVAGEKVENANYNVNVTNWWKRFPDPDNWSKFLAEKTPRLSADGEKFLAFESMGLFVAPKNDSVKMVQISFYGGGSLSSLLKLRPLQNTEDNPRYTYDYRPFTIQPSESKVQRIPLLLIGSFWWDEQFKIHRFCGVSEFAPDMTDEELNFIPHYYVIGIEISKIE